MAYNKRNLAENEVKWIVELYKTPMGCRRISMITGCSFTQVRDVIRGLTYVDITGGDLRCGLRKEAIWRHSTKSYEQVQREQSETKTAYPS